MSGLSDELHVAAARRAIITDRLAMGDPDAKCMACRAKGLIAAAIVVFGLGALVLGPRRPS